MNKDFQRYMDSGVLGGYAPERVVGFQMEDKITPIYRDTTYHETENGIELCRQMIVGGRCFLVRSIFSASEKAKTPTEQMLQIIDSDLKKDSICG